MEGSWIQQEMEVAEKLWDVLSTRGRFSRHRIMNYLKDLSLEHASQEELNERLADLVVQQQIMADTHGL